MAKLKVKINTILPLALAILLPGLSFYTNSGMRIPPQLGIAGTWLATSIILYLLWYLLWFSWDIQPRAKKAWYILFVGLVVIGLNMAIYFAMSFIGTGFEWSIMLRIILGMFLYWAIQYALKTQERLTHALLEKEQAQTENYRVQLSALRAKIDPHFLFNSLNTLRSMVRQHHNNSEEFIMSLSDFYRHTLKYNEDTTLPLDEELAVLQSFLFLMKSRNEEAVKIDLNIDEGLHEFHLPTLALQVVLENCFKHNSMTSRKPLMIQIRNSDDYYIVVSNNVQPKIGNQESSGYGLDLLRKRYELMNVENGVLIEDSPELFTIKLKLI